MNRTPPVRFKAAGNKLKQEIKSTAVDPKPEATNALRCHDVYANVLSYRAKTMGILVAKPTLLDTNDGFVLWMLIT